MKRKCIVCGKEYESKAPRSVACSAHCIYEHKLQWRREYYKKNQQQIKEYMLERYKNDPTYEEIKTCPICKKEFPRDRSRKYCSAACAKQAAKIGNGAQPCARVEVYEGDYFSDEHIYLCAIGADDSCLCIKRYSFMHATQARLAIGKCLKNISKYPKKWARWSHIIRKDIAPYKFDKLLDTGRLIAICDIEKKQWQFFEMLPLSKYLLKEVLPQ